MFIAGSTYAESNASTGRPVKIDGVLMTGFLLTGLTTGVFPKNDHVLFSEVFFLKAGYRQDVMCNVTVGSL